MKFDDLFPVGEMPPFSDLRRHLYYSGFTFKCTTCHSPTNWLIVAMQAAICSEECMNSQIEQKTNGIKVTPLSYWPGEGNDGEIANSDNLSPGRGKSLPGVVSETTKT
jgi:hypothetical protein